WHYWKHLTEDALREEAAANHSFHVFGIYPWTRLLGRGGDHPVRVLDNCRITWGRIRAREDDHVVVECSRLVFDGHRLALSTPEPRSVPVWTDGYAAVP